MQARSPWTACWFPQALDPKLAGHLTAKVIPLFLGPVETGVGAGRWPRGGTRSPAPPPVPGLGEPPRASCAGEGLSVLDPMAWTWAPTPEPSEPQTETRSQELTSLTSVPFFPQEQ